jgi:long-chain acyl-CoA synthetase
MLVPTMINLIVNHPKAAMTDFSRLRSLMYGASPMPSELQRRAVEVFGPVLTQLYGMTEAAPLVTELSAADHVRGMAGEEPFTARLRSAGRPVMGVRAEVRLDDGFTRAPVGVPGEVYVSGPNVMLGYWRRPEETADALGKDGWYRSGDVAYADEGGYLYIVDRAKDMIISGGENVYSPEVENVLYEHAAVLECAVVGVPHEKWGEMVHAIVVPRPDTPVTADELIDFAKERIAGFKAPRSVELRDEPLPKSGAGKILKRDLSAPYWQGKERAVN